MQTQDAVSQLPTAQLRLLARSLQSLAGGQLSNRVQEAAARLIPEETPAVPLTAQELSNLALAMGQPLPGDELQELSPQELADKAAAEQSLYEFIRQAWHVLEPDVEFIPGWHLEAISRHLEAIADPDSDGGVLQNLMLNVPPGTMKSLATAVFFCAWVWGPHKKPSTRFLCASYGQDLSLRDSLKVRQLIESDWYQKRWGDVFKLLLDENKKTRFENDKRGWRMATSVGGRGTGEHPDIVIIDDPHKAKDSKNRPTVETDAERAAVLEWYDSTIVSRGAIRGARRVLVMQRLHEDDLCGHILASQSASDWTLICLPMWYEPNRMVATPLGWNDPRDVGDLLWPNGYTEVKARKLERDLGSSRAAGQLQQRPTKAGGLMFQRQWFQIIDVLPPDIRNWVRFWDKASTPGGGAYTVGVLMGEKAGKYYVADVLRKQLSPEQRNSLMKQTAMLDAARCGGNVVRIVIEQEPAAGKETGLINIKELAGYPVYLERVSRAKEERALPWASYCEAGCVYLLEAPWNAAYLDEHEVFPNGKYKDQTDASAGAFNKLALANWNDTSDPLIASGDASPDDLRAMTPQEIAELDPGLRAIIEGGDEGESDDFGLPPGWNGGD